MTEGYLPRVAVVGRPNVGKSTLVNRLSGTRKSIVGEVAGLTRDRLDVDASWRGKDFVLHDTGGLIESALGAEAGDTITAKVAARALATLEDSDAVLFVIDGTAGVTSDDVALVSRLRKVTAPLLLVANKIDDAGAEVLVHELWSLGLGEPIPVSALHGRGAGELLDRLVEVLPEHGASERTAVPAIAIVGRPNVGKSSLFNRIVGEDRAIVHHEPGTTRDTIDTLVEVDGKTYRFVDTAGIRRRAKTHGVEIFSASRTRAAIGRSNVAVLVIDASDGATSQDQKIAEMVAEAGATAIIALNKWDLIEGPVEAEKSEETLEDRLRFVSYAPMVRTSAKTKRGVSKLLDQLPVVLESSEVRITTAELNQIFADAQQKVPPPRVANKTVKILYATQAGTAPPTFVLFTTGQLPTTWLRFAERLLRERYGFVGAPIHFTVRDRAKDRKTRKERQS